MYLSTESLEAMLPNLIRLDFLKHILLDNQIDCN